MLSVHFAQLKAILYLQVILGLKIQLLSRMEEFKFTVPINVFMTMWYTVYSIV
jgi:hypothetical protein